MHSQSKVELMGRALLYGLPSVLARAEGYDPPRHPRCTLMTYRFSDVWRYFDHGLYRFMLKHIYIPWVGRDSSLARQLQGTALVFTFVCVWHGVHSNVLWWAAVNFLAVVAERLADLIAKEPRYMGWEARWLPGAWRRRFLGGVAGAPYVPSLAALVIFLSDMDNATTVTTTIFVSDFPKSTVTCFLFMFCLGQCSMELQNCKMRQKARAKQA
ncbi:Protein-cysteine N-palmitoyltransferase Rasp [Chionoecetes opilio]|uniref:Protein-cysteine N-palmitoyltransferase Rasp n=1 Tax=Chionoecetes opilio TaxID=41210 RepID=A0A8J5CM22_CHIOP|nr:Protein-cysteine N-palmitoyltransferase Rasp [Chionoecetes opilio]